MVRIALVVLFTLATAIRVAPSPRLNVELMDFTGQAVKRLVGSDGRCLNFLHIPKTAGSTIEQDSARLVGNSSIEGWGMKDWALRECSQRATTQWPKCNFRATHNGRTESGSCSAWHVPPYADPVLLKHYGECETFCVVRHPTARLVSQYRNWLQPCDSSMFESWAVDSLQQAKWNRYMGDCHFVPQVEYVFGLGSAAPHCQHVLHYETLRADFQALMDDFGLPVRLHSHLLNHHCEVKVSRRLEKLIESVYGMDFDAFGYERTASHMRGPMLFSVEDGDD